VIAYALAEERIPDPITAGDFMRGFRNDGIVF
jgi:hypothetical protein